MLAAVLLVAGASRAFAEADPLEGSDPVERVERAERDEYGVLPDDARDRDLSLPDPVLDRSWPGPKPGEDGRMPRDDDEFEKDPLREEEPPPPPSPKPEPRILEGMPPRTHTAPPAASPNGAPDAGTPAPEPELPDVLEPDVPPLSDMEKEELAPSPLDEDDHEYNREAQDPAEW